MITLKELQKTFQKTDERYHKRDNGGSEREQILGIVLMDQIELLEHLIAECKYHSEYDALWISAIRGLISIQMRERENDLRIDRSAIETTTPVWNHPW